MEHKLISVMHKCPKDLEAKGYELWVASVINAAESISGGQTRDITSAARHLQVNIRLFSLIFIKRTGMIYTSFPFVSLFPIYQ